MARYVITGTRAYGPAREDSDLDIVMLSADSEALKSLLNSLGVDYELKHPDKPDYSGYTIYLLNDFPPVNIITASSEEEMMKWHMATEFMKKIPPVQDRAERIELFKKLRE